MDWLDLLAIQGTLKSVLQHYSLKASILQHSAFFTVQLSHPYTTTGKTIALTRRTFVRKVVSVFFNMLSRFVIAFPPMRKMGFFCCCCCCLFVCFVAAVTICSDFGAQENKINVKLLYELPRSHKTWNSSPLGLYPVALPHSHQRLWPSLCNLIPCTHTWLWAVAFPLCLPTMSFPLIFIYLPLYCHSYSQMPFLQRCPVLCSSLC